MNIPDEREIERAYVYIQRIQLYQNAVADRRIGAMRPTDEETERYHNDVITLSALAQKWEREMEEAG